MTENEEQKRIREKAESDVEDLARWQAQKQNLPKEYEEILVKASLDSLREQFRNHTNASKESSK